MDAVATVRSFNRFYTKLVGALDAHFLGTDLSLAEARLLFEIAHAERPLLALDLQARLDMDPGFVSRVLRRFETRGWIERGRGDDARQRPILLTKAGRTTFAELDARQLAAVRSLLDRVQPERQPQLVDALDTARLLLAAEVPAFSIRTFRPGDMGMIAGRQAKLYAEGWGWERPMEVLLGEVTTTFLKEFKPGREQCWVAESGGRMAGSIFLVEGEANVARLRLLYVEPWARGAGIGHALVDRCISAAREAGYEAVELWTHTVLDSARRIYTAAGFRIIREEMHESFGKPEQGEIWRLELAPVAASAEAT